MKPSIPLLAAIATGVVFSAAAAIGIVTLLRGEAPAGSGLGLDPFRAAVGEVREAYCRYALAQLVPGAGSPRLVNMRERGEPPVVVLTFDAGTQRSISCEFVPPDLIAGHTRLAVITLDAEPVSVERLDGVNVALAHEERLFRR
ncbi:MULTISPECIES: hypothetical protein [Chelatococcus]|uniref:Uncharacterized protein n=1 Tax=Chelatococcus caeni TaxID=1348468 RepID=A0A840C421_9HYPH|nr:MULTISPECIES: hypothetical protein [Chelatococcus]ALA16825.1 hypothetical protein AL346_04635 [Chelatococcus sp. CO-6]MBB4019860.1 hypothetical protein [Chelatococcus caeni]